MIKVLGDNRSLEKFRSDYAQAIEKACLKKTFGYLATWTNALAVGSIDCIEKLGNKIPDKFKKKENVAVISCNKGKRLRNRL